MSRRTIACAGLVLLLVLLCTVPPVTAVSDLPVYPFLFNKSNSDADWDLNMTGVAIGRQHPELTFVTDLDGSAVQIYDKDGLPLDCWMTTELWPDPPAALAVNSSSGSRPLIRPGSTSTI
jgi:hypothetical protein